MTSSVLGNKKMVKALLDGLRHRYHTIRIQGESLRELQGYMDVLCEGLTEPLLFSTPPRSIVRQIALLPVARSSQAQVGASRRALKSFAIDTSRSVCDIHSFDTP